MTTRTIAHKCDCSRCGRSNELHLQTEFNQLCLTLLSGGTGEVHCGCGQAEQIVWRGGQLQQIVDQKTKEAA